MKGVNRLRPPLPRYTSTWDVGQVLELFAAWPDNTKLSLKQLSLKLVGLLALTSAQRVQTLASILIGDVIWNEPVQIVLSSRLKTTSANRPNLPIILASFPSNSNLCVVKTLQTYIERTKSIRTSNKLLISYLSPHHAVTSQSISRWLTSLLKEAGIDDSLFKGHSYRHAATSFAKEKGVTVDVIFKQAGWSEKSKVFAKFYNKPIDSRASFGSTILSAITSET